MESNKHKSLEDLTKGLLEKTQQINNGKWELETVESFYNEARSLYERAVILRAKAFTGKDIPELEKNEKKPTDSGKAIVEEKKEKKSEEKDLPMFDFTNVKEEPKEVESSNQEKVTQKKETPTPPSREEEEEISDNKQEDLQDQDKNTSEETDSPDEKMNEPKSKDEHEADQQDQEDNADIMQSDENEQANDAPNVEEKISSQQEIVNSINDHFKNAEDSSLLENMKKKPIENLRAAIGINDKFSYIQDLFDGENALYEVALDKLNNLKDADEAKVMLSEMAMENKWDLESKSVMQFVELIERRYAEE